MEDELLKPTDLVLQEGRTTWQAVSDLPALIAPQLRIEHTDSLDANSPASATLDDPAAWEVSEYAGFPSRVIAYLVDQLVVLPLTLVLSIIAYGIDVLTQPGHASRGDLGILIVVVGTVVSWIYCAVLESSQWQATLGKKALDLFVTDLDGSRISYSTATGRHFGKLLSALGGGLGFLAITFSLRKQAWHDSMAGTLVLRRGS